MNIQYYELADNRYLGLTMLEVAAVPSINSCGKDSRESCERVSQEFQRILSESYKMVQQDICIEVLWITEKAMHQAFLSKTHIYLVLRKMGADKIQIAYELENLEKNLCTSLKLLQYGIESGEDTTSTLQELIHQVNDSCVYSVGKGEKCIGNANSLYPYYYSDVIPNDNFLNFNALIATMSQQENCCVSFQLFPTQFSASELYMINEVSGELGRIASGMILNREMYRDAAAEEPFKAYSYYNHHRNAPCFLYNILAFGEKACCAALATKLVSLIQSGEKAIVSCDPVCIDLSGEKIKLEQQFPYYVWNVNTKLMYYYRNKKLQEAVPLAKNMFRLPFIVTVEEATAFFRMPLYEKSMPAIRNNQIIQTQEQFAKEVVNENNIQIGKLITNDNMQVMIGCPEKAFTKHALIVGMPGVGKTTFSVNLLLQFWKKGIPFLAIEPTKTEYRAMIDTIPELQIFTPGNNSVSPFVINPFIPPKGIRLEQYIPSLTNAFKAAFKMQPPLDMFFLKAVRVCYMKYGWKDYNQTGDPDVTLFGLQEFIIEFKELMKSTNYSKDVRGNIESAGLVRLSNLIEQNSNIYDSIHTIPLEDMLTKPTILELNSIDNMEQKSLIMALLLINICLYTKHNQAGDGKMKNAILIDEAHVLLGGGADVSDSEANSQAITTKALQDMIVEIRSYGTSIIIADQSPTKVSREIVANTDIKVAFRLVQSAEKELIADSTDMGEDERNRLSKLKVGEAYVYYNMLNTPQMVMTEDIRKKEGIRLSVSNEEVAEKSTYLKTHKRLFRPYFECEKCRFCREECEFKVRSIADHIAGIALEKYRASLNEEANIRKLIFHLENLMQTEWDRYPEINRKHLVACAKIKLYRKCAMEFSFRLKENEKELILYTEE